VVSDHDFSQVALLPLLVLSPSGPGVGWLSYYIASNAVAFSSDYLTFSFPFHQLLLPAAVALAFRPRPPSGQIRVVRPPLACGKAVGSLDLLALPFHTTPGECDIKPGTVAASDIGRLMAKFLAMTGASSALLRLETHYAFSLGS
jgi:hypothetical protein